MSRRRRSPREGGCAPAACVGEGSVRTRACVRARARACGGRGFCACTREQVRARAWPVTSPPGRHGKRSSSCGRTAPAPTGVGLPACGPRAASPGCRNSGAQRPTARRAMSPRIAPSRHGSRPSRPSSRRLMRGQRTCDHPHSAGGKRKWPLRIPSSAARCPSA